MLLTPVSMPQYSRKHEMMEVLTCPHLPHSYKERRFHPQVSADAGCSAEGKYKNDWSNYNQANDYSHNGSLNTYTSWSKVTAYYQGQLIWGSEP